MRRLLRPTSVAMSVNCNEIKSTMIEIVLLLALLMAVVAFIVFRLSHRADSEEPEHYIPPEDPLSRRIDFGHRGNTDTIPRSKEGDRG